MKDDLDELLSPDDPDKPKGRSRGLSPDQIAQRDARLAKEASELQASLDSGNLTTLRTRVAWILHEFPHTRDSDVSLTLKYWERYQPETYNATGMMPRDLFKLERFTHIARVRAKIQNEYRLFPANQEIRRRRKANEEAVREEVTEDKPGRNVIHVYADETGKNQEHICVAAVWAMTGRSVFEVSRTIWEWKRTSPFNGKELHFSALKKNDTSSISKYLDAILAKKELLSFKAISIEKASTRRPVEEIVQRLHEFMIVRGAEHEIQSGRIRLPHEISLTVDAEQSLDEIACADIAKGIATSFAAMHGDRLTIEQVKSAASHKSDMIQLADMVAGSINRVKNHRGEPGFKDEIARMVIDRLNIQLEPGEIPNTDATAWLSI